MVDKTQAETDQEQTPARVLADFGGRRRIFDRRIRPRAIFHQNRRKRMDRRSGFDRRSALNQKDAFVDDNRLD
jgi:hypothetical protein